MLAYSNPYCRFYLGNCCPDNIIFSEVHQFTCSGFRYDMSRPKYFLSSLPTIGVRENVRGSHNIHFKDTVIWLFFALYLGRWFRVKNNYFRTISSSFYCSYLTASVHVHLCTVVAVNNRLYRYSLETYLK